MSAAAGTIELYGQLYSRVLRLDSDGKLAPGLASSWEVSDGGTQALMSTFYRYLKQPGTSKAEALRKAQLLMG